MSFRLCAQNKNDILSAVVNTTRRALRHGFKNKEEYSLWPPIAFAFQLQLWHLTRQSPWFTIDNSRSHSTTKCGCGVESVHCFSNFASLDWTYRNSVGKSGSFGRLEEAKLCSSCESLEFEFCFPLEFAFWGKNSCVGRVPFIVICFLLFLATVWECSSLINKQFWGFCWQALRFCSSVESISCCGWGVWWAWEIQGKQRRRM